MELDRGYVQVEEAGVELLFLVVFVGGVVQDLFEFPEVPGSRDDVEEYAAGSEHASELGRGEGSETVDEEVSRVVGGGQVVDGGHSELVVRATPSGFFDGWFREVHPGDATALLGYGYGQGLSVPTLTAARVQQGGALWGVQFDQGAEGVPEGSVPAAVQETGPSGGHIGVVAWGFGVALVGGEEVYVTLSGPVEAVSGGTAV